MTNTKQPTKAEIQKQLDDAAEANAEFAAANEQLASENEALKGEVSAMRTEFAELKKALNAPTSIRKTAESEDYQQGQDHPFEFGEGNEIIQAGAETIEDPAFQAKAEYMRFMEEPVRVYIQESNGDFDESSFTIWVNGRPETFTEGQEKTVARKYLEGLARAKKTTYRNSRKTRDDGENFYQYIPRTGVRYPFAVVEDRNPRGRAWLEAVLRQP